MRVFPDVSTRKLPALWIELLLSTQPMEILLLLVCFLLLVLVALAIMLLREIQKQKQPSVPQQKHPVAQPSQLHNQPNSPPTFRTIPTKESFKQPLVPSQMYQPKSPIQTNPKNPTKQPLTSFPSFRPHSPKTRTIYGQIAKLLHGDSNAVNRLIDSQRAKNPDKSEEWIYEKVLSDLTRDRR